MSISTPQGGGGSRRTTAVSTGSPGKKAAASKAAASGKAASAAKKAPAKAAPKQGGKGGGPRRPIAPVKVSQGRSWGPIALFLAVALLAVGIVGYGAYYVYRGSLSWQDRANGISGIMNYGKNDPELVKPAQHKTGSIDYKIKPPVAGPHNEAWQRCQGDVYDAPIASEHAVHSMEHGAVWITYRPDLPKDQVDKLAAKVRGNDYMLMSPFDGLDKPISLQAWGYQLKVDNANDKRIDDFVKALLGQAGPEKGATCSSGNYVTATGTTPRDMSQQQQGTPGG